MNISLGIPFSEFNFKLVQGNNSTIDAQSRQEETYSHWEPMWFQIQNSEKLPNPHNICPCCSKFVSLSDEPLACESPQGRFYLAHSICANDVVQFTEYGYTAKKISNKEILGKQNHKIGCHQYFIQLTIQHPLSPKKFYSNSLKMLEHENKLSFYANSFNTDQFQPNFIVLPMKQFKCCVKINPMISSQQSSPYTLYFRIDLSKQNNGVHIIKFQQNGVSFLGEFQIIKDSETKTQIVDNMNYKYKRPYLLQSFVKLNSFTIQFKDAESQENPQTIHSLPNQDLKKEEFPVFEVLVKPPLSPTKTYFQASIPEPYNTYNSDTQFLNNIKTQAGSKQFQKKVKNLKIQQIQNIVNQIIPHLSEIIMNQYANYMFQSLLGTCTFEQRMKIILKVADILTNLVCQQQGTFVFQQLIALLTNMEQFSCICVPAAKDFKRIALDNYGNHFMRKLIQNMPRDMISNFMPAIFQNFLQFAKNKNAVCVMKCIIRSLCQGQNTSQEVAHHLKRFIDTLTFSTKQLINDEYGNYLIQEVYELIESQRLSGVTQYIINVFIDCSCEKFSSNVVLNCIKKYWRKNVAVYKKLKQILQNKNINYMYHSKEGNKVLLEIMELPMQLGLKDKIAAVLRNQEPSKYNNRRWVGVTGKSKTGAVGSTNYTNFSEAISFTKRKHYN